MYKLNVSYTDYKGTAKRADVTFNLDGREVFKMLPELKSLFEWIEANREEEPRELDIEEVRTFYNNLEGVILEAYGEMSEDGQHFRKAGRFEFEESAAFNACMMLFVNAPKEAVMLLEGIMPKELMDRVKNADANQVAEVSDSRIAEMDSEIRRLRAQITEQGETTTS